MERINLLRGKVAKEASWLKTTVRDESEDPQ
jgi:hypothetical protein